MANSYSYNEYGNRTGAVLGGTAVSYTYDKNNRLTKESATAGGTTTDVLYQYDPNGNRVSVVTSSVTTEQAGTAGISLELPQLETALNRYDAFGRLVESEITKDGARTLAQYTYNASGYRTSKTVNGVTTEHVLDGANVAADVVGGQVTQYVRGLGLTALVQADGTRLQYVTDGHGDVKKLISGSGVVVADYTYDAFGNQTSETEDVNPFRYAGEYWDSESGLIYLRARYYDAGVGGFTSEDPARDGENWYGYCDNDPINYKDPTGYVKEGDDERFGTDSLKYKLLVALGNAWTNAREADRATIEATADRLRAFDDSSFDRAIFLNDENGAYGAGHNATMLLNSSGEGLVFSYYPTSQESEWDLVFGVDGEMRIGVLTADQANNLMYGDGWTGQMVATDGHLENEQYERFAYYGIKTGQGYNMYHKATQIAQNPGTYKLAGNQCDNITQQIFAAGEINYTVKNLPNWSYNDLENSSKWTR